jgi:hypothetical protein
MTMPWQDRLTKLRAVAEGNPGRTARLVLEAWELVVTFDNATGWALSAQLYPYGRSSSTNDWMVLGKLARALGAPPDPVTPIEDTLPNEPVIWRWA